MRKIIFSTMLAGMLLQTSCKGEKKEFKEDSEAIKTEISKELEKLEPNIEKTAKEGAEVIKSALDEISIPKFENQEVTKNIEGYMSYAKEYINSKGAALTKIDFVKKGANLLKERNKLISSLDDKAAEEYNHVINEIQSKMDMIIK